MQQQEKYTISFCDFNEEEDRMMLESIFSSDYAMLNSKHKEEPYSIGIGVKTFKNCASDAKTDKRKILQIDNKSVGFLIYFTAYQSSFKNLQDGDGVLVLMGIHPDHRCKGYGSIIMQYLLERFEELKCERGWLSVNKDNINAQKLYTKFGFQKSDHKSWGESHWWMVDLKHRKK